MDNLTVQIETEEDLYTHTPANNGAGPQWCYGSTCIGRVDQQIFVSGLETIPQAKPLNNVRWVLYQKGPGGWKVAQQDKTGRTREPSPLAVFPDGHLFLSVNPTLTEPDTYSGPAQPQLLEFPASPCTGRFNTLLPAWEDQPAFTEHSYRSLATDGSRNELILFNILGHEALHWSFLDRTRTWSARGRLCFPMGEDYEEPEPIRICYPEVALVNRAVHLLGISDIVEPVKAWRQFKQELTGKGWDYDFRRLFYTWTPDVTAAPFAPWVEIASREKTCGWINNLDLNVSPQGWVDLLWLEKSLDVRLRERFFPGESLTITLNYGRVKDGQVCSCLTLLEWAEGTTGEVPVWGRFHRTGDGRLFVFYACRTEKDRGEKNLENRLIEILPEAACGKEATVGLTEPLGSFMTATPRAGNLASELLDLYGHGPDSLRLRYACLRIKP